MYRRYAQNNQYRAQNMAQKYKSKVKPLFAILRTKKLKSKSKLTAAAEHNLRLRTQANIDADRSHLNQILYNPLGIDSNDATSFQRKLSEHYSSLGIKIKAENTLAFEYAVTASPKFFEGKTTEQIGKWAYHQVEFMRKEFGDKLQFGVLHLDETTPHIHFFVSTEQRSIKKYKNRYALAKKKLGRSTVKKSTLSTCELFKIIMLRAIKFLDYRAALNIRN